MARESLYNLANPGESVAIEGILTFSNLREKKMPNNPSQYDTKPVYQVTIADPKVVDGADTELGKHVLDEGISHGAYQSKSGKWAGHTMWGFNSASNYPIQIFSKTTGSQSANADEVLTGELASGQTVTILFSIYEGKRPNGGVPYVSGQLDGVVIEDAENIKYFNAGASKYEDFLGAPKGDIRKAAAKANGGANPAENTQSQDDTAPSAPEASANETNDDASLNNKAKNLFD